MREDLVFQERQRFNQYWIIALFVFLNGLFIYRCICQIGLGKPWGNNPANNTALIIITISTLLLTISFFFMYLDTFINKEGVYFRMFPFHLRFKFIPWDQVSEASVRKFNPLVTGGGWGIRSGIGYRTYTVSGNKVLKLVLKNNKTIYVGTRRFKELSEFLIELDANCKCLYLV